jgi:hypothetical protein
MTAQEVWKEKKREGERGRKRQRIKEYRRTAGAVRVLLTGKRQESKGAK